MLYPVLVFHSFLLLTSISWTFGLFLLLGYYKLKCCQEYSPASLCVDMILHFSSYIPRSRISGSYGKFVFNLLRNCQGTFQSDYVILYYHQQCMRFPISLHPCQHLSLSVFFIITVLGSVKWYLIVIIIRIS